ncbi:hypothetical protein [Streptomyces sp. A012304]|nr:hypothetical protein [Streptomyces sp. A012304]GKQ37876.1 hypothetical protein ALMP_44120 [Streptomyces sp. A012304]
MRTTDTYTRLIELLEASDARYRLLHRSPEGRAPTGPAPCAATASNRRTP